MPRKRKRRRKDDFWEGLLGLVVGFLGVAVLAELTKPRCPNCNAQVSKGESFCPKCFANLEVLNHVTASVKDIGPDEIPRWTEAGFFLALSDERDFWPNLRSNIVPAKEP